MTLPHEALNFLEGGEKGEGKNPISPIFALSVAASSEGGGRGGEDPPPSGGDKEDGKREEDRRSLPLKARGGGGGGGGLAEELRRPRAYKPMLILLAGKYHMPLFYRKIGP